MSIYRESNALCIEFGPDRRGTRRFEIMLWWDCRPRIRFYDWKKEFPD